VFTKVKDLYNRMRSNIATEPQNEGNGVQMDWPEEGLGKTIE
jgi:hypothetical protein